MPKILDRLVKQLIANGMEKDKAYAVAVSKMQKAGNLKRGSLEPTKRGVKRGNMTPAERAKDRAATKSKSSTKSYKYNKTNNTAVKGKINKNVKPRS